jgi:hypothetical protein
VRGLHEGSQSRPYSGANNLAERIRSVMNAAPSSSALANDPHAAVIGSTDLFASCCRCGGVIDRLLVDVRPANRSRLSCDKCKTTLRRNARNRWNERHPEKYRQHTLKKRKRHNKRRKKIGCNGFASGKPWSSSEDAEVLRGKGSMRQRAETIGRSLSSCWRRFWILSHPEKSYRRKVEKMTDEYISKLLLLAGFEANDQLIEVWRLQLTLKRTLKILRHENNAPNP